MNEIYYVYPKYKNMSFSNIAKAHIQRLKPKVKIQEIDEDVLGHLMWLKPRNILLHPILYVTIGDKAGQFDARQERLRKLLKVKGKLGGFETADSDKISKVAIESINKLDVAFLPSKWAIEVFKKSGAKLPLRHLPHGVSEAMSVPDKKITNESIINIQKLKKKHDAVLILYFMVHSEYRKGADIVYDAMDFLQQKNKNFYLVFKRGQGESTINQKFKRLRTIEVSSWMPDIVLKQLYDVCDMLLVPSRGGGFEMNAIEGLARGLPTLVPNAGCFKDYIEYAVPLPVTGYPQVFPDNPIHQGRGWETHPDQLMEAIESVAYNLEVWKEKTEDFSKIIRQEYSWNHICETLYNHLVEFGFCEKP